MGCYMLDANLKSNVAVLDGESDGVKIMYEFLRFSAHPDISGQAVEDHLLGSLAIALNGRETAN